jgi:hypothetical protein
MLGELTLQSAQQVFPLISLLISSTGRCPIVPQSIEQEFPQTDSNAAEELASLFNHYGSDKSSTHNYHLVYASLLAPRRCDPLRILEIGIGSNNLDVASNMGASGTPGASLRSFRDFCPKAELFGADIDRRILFSEDRIFTYYVDQTQLSSFDDLSAAVGDQFDLVIDDGLHSPNANLATILFALCALGSNGCLVIEDIHVNSLPFWQTIAALLPDDYHPALLQTQSALVFTMRRPS